MYHTHSGISAFVFFGAMSAIAIGLIMPARFAQGAGKDGAMNGGAMKRASDMNHGMKGKMKPGMMAMKKALMALAKYNKVKFEPSTVCASCHETIVREWATSMHAHSREAWYFSHKVSSERMGMTCNNERHEAIACQTCHEPGGVYPFGAVIQRKPPAVAATEGVTCDICHRVTEVRGTGELVFGPKEEKRGPLKDARSPYHKTVYSPLIESSQFCLGCHGQLFNLNGLNVCNTLNTWKNSKYAAEGKTCQSCHMPSFSGPVAVGPGAPKDAPSKRTRHSHIFRGPNSDPSILREAATVTQEVTKTGDGGLKLVVKVTNSGTGHDLPTGLPERLITLKVEGKDKAGNVIWQNWREDVYHEDRLAAFGLFGFNPRGGEVPPMGAARIDNLSLLPGETRTLVYTLKARQARDIVRFEARLTYYAARPDGVFYFGTHGLPALKPKLMAEVTTAVK